MRWDDLFADLEVEADGLAQRDRDAEIAERTRIELAALTLLDRLQAGIGYDVVLDVVGAGTLAGRLARVGPAWLLLDVDGRTGWAVAVGAVTGIDGLPAAAAPPGEARPPAVRATWASAFRTLSRDREVVLVKRVDGAAVRGVPARVGRDFVEIWWRDDEASGVARGAPPRLTVVPYAAVAAVSVRTSS